MIITRTENGSYVMRYALTATQKSILKMVGMSEDEIRRSTMEIAKRYEKK